MLSLDHDVTLLRTGCERDAGPARPGSVQGVRELACGGSELPGISFACEDHAHAAAALEALRTAYGEDGPDYLEAPDFRAHGLVALQAQRGGDSLLAKTTIAVRLIASSELIFVHDGLLDLPGRERLAAIEREQLRLAQRIVWPGGDSLDLLARYHEGLDLPSGTLIAPPLPAQPTAPSPVAADDAAPLRILYAARLQRHRGPLDLVEACLSLPDDDWRLTLAGEDTETATMHQSVRATIEAMSGDDPRIVFLPALSPAELTQCAAEHDLLAVPSRVEAWSNTALLAMRAGLPVLASPVGGLATIVEHGVSGWHTDGFGADAFNAALSRLLADPGVLRRMRRSGAPAARAALLTDPERVRAGYAQLLVRSSRQGAARPEAEPLVTGVIPYYDASPYVADAVDSLLGQTHRNLDVLIVNDGSFLAADAILDELARRPRVSVVHQINRGESAARNLGALLAGGDYVAMLDADNMLEPTFVERCLAVLRRDASLAYATCWLRMVDVDGGALPEPVGYAALGNSVLDDADEQNWDGDTIAVLPRALFAEQGFAYDAGGVIQSDWALYRALRQAGRVGAVVPAQLARYRVVAGSLLRTHSDRLQQRSWREAVVRRRHGRTAWLAGGTA